MPFVAIVFLALSRKATLTAFTIVAFNTTPNLTVLLLAVDLLDKPEAGRYQYRFCTGVIFDLRDVHVHLFGIGDGRKQRFLFKFLTR